MDTVKIPLWVRVVAYFVGLITASLGAGLVAWLLAKHHIDNIDAAFLIVILGTISLIAHTLSLTNLTLNTQPSANGSSTPNTLGPDLSQQAAEVYDPATDGTIDTTTVSGSEAAATS